MINTQDKIWNITAVGAWDLAELSIGIIGSCFPVVPKFAAEVGRQICSMPHRSFVRRFRQKDSAAIPSPLPNDNIQRDRNINSKTCADLTDPCDPYRRLNGSDYALEEWEVRGRSQAGEQYRSEIMSPSLKLSETGLASGEIVQTLSFVLSSHREDDQRVSEGKS